MISVFVPPIASAPSGRKFDMRVFVLLIDHPSSKAVASNWRVDVYVYKVSHIQ